ncbi:MAG: ZIP family metal transporter [Lachnospiraceae bacterium]|jgi:Predicted divalent heavy-metal cations transporter|nr:ZIP family metal transporter [Lachnospiraceae bacterium]MCI8826964.1 ZIP family metal transporter [Lachnospiraceae bacterium]MCI9371330.1 ZIP family metal transporter [Lachnospiraceae bacterium]
MLLGIMIPFIGTTLGAACVFFMQKAMNITLQKILSGFAAGVMVAASVWSLLIPSMDMAENLGKLAFLPAAAGMMFGIAFLLFLDRLIPHLHVNEEKPEGPKTSLKKSSMLILAVTLHNIPEGMAVGAVFAGMLADSELITVMGAFALSIGIAIQNLPEGAIISMPVCAAGLSKKKAFMYGMLSGVVEPVGAVLTIWLSGFLIPLLPYLLSFAAGAMIYVVVEELIPEAVEGEHTNIGTISFAVGFVLMMALDVALG